MNPFVILLTGPVHPAMRGVHPGVLVDGQAYFPQDRPAPPSVEGDAAPHPHHPGGQQERPCAVP